MESRLIKTATVLLALTLTGGRAQVDVCGQAPLNNKIVGGADAPPGTWPWQVSIHRSAHFCGGSLISNQWVLSAAHCFTTESPGGFLVYLGRDTQQNFNPNEVSRTLEQIIRHPDYDDTPNNNDVSLLKLSSPVEFTNYIRPVCLAAAASEFPAGTETWVTGWGTIRVGVSLPSPQTLQEVMVPVVSNQQCSIAYTGITDNMVCAGLTEGGKDSCQGDSGGPMVYQGSRWVLLGVVSFGRGCAEPNAPGVYARVSRYQDWINSQVSGVRPGFVLPSGITPQPPTSRVVSFSCSLLLFFLPVVFSLYLFS